jgi:hypothetical protein
MTDADRAVEKCRILIYLAQIIYHFFRERESTAHWYSFFLWWSLYQPFLDVVEYSN